MSRTSLPIGTELDRYTIRQMLVEDGRGISYLADDTGSVSGSARVIVREYFPRGISVRNGILVEPRDRDAAADEFAQGLKGFVKAANALMSMQTHTLVTTLDVFEKNDTAYLIQENPSAKSLFALVDDDQTIGVDTLRSQLDILLRGLEDLHEAGLVHTCISPSTLIRMDDGYPAITKLTHVEHLGGEETNRTHLVFDTPYAAPELAAKSSVSIGPWTDVYSLSATCWYLLTGTPPATAKDRNASIENGRGDLIAPQMLIELDEEHRKIAKVLMKGLALDPEQRFQSAADFLKALNGSWAWQLPTFFESGKSWITNHKPVAAAGVLAAAALGLTVFVFPQTDSPAPSEQLIAETITADLAFKNPPIVNAEPKIQQPTPAQAAWNLVDRNDPNSLRDFLEAHASDGDLSAVALVQLTLLDEQAWEAASTKDTMESYQNYLAAFSADAQLPGKYVSDAQKNIQTLARAHEFRVAEARRLLFALGYKTNKARGETEGLRRAVLGFQELAGVPTDGVITDDLISLMTEEVARRDEASEKLVVAKAPAEVEDKTEVVTKPKSSVTSSSGKIVSKVTHRWIRPPEKKAEPPSKRVPLPTAEPIITHQTKIASSTIEVKEEIIANTEKDTVIRIDRKAGDTFKDCDACPSLVVIPKGSFEMGSPVWERHRSDAEGPVHTVTISKPFAMGMFEVTVTEFNTFVRDTGRSVSNTCAVESDIDVGNWKTKQGVSFRNIGFEQSDNHPAACISWDDARAYTKWLSAKTGQTYRLASESEWEYAARGNSSRAHSFGRNFSNGCEFANGADRSAEKVREAWKTVSCNDGHYTSAAVGSFKPNAFGLYDTIGNVWEWTEDCFTDDYSNTPRSEAPNTSVGCKARVIRGGSWASSVEMLRSASRSGDNPSARYNMVGFRIVRELEQP